MSQSQTLMPDIPHSQYIDIVKFLTQVVQQESAEGSGVGGKRLRNLYLDHYLDKSRLDDEEYLEGEKKLITQTIRFTVQEEILKPVPVSEGIGFVIHPLCNIVNPPGEVQTTAKRSGRPIAKPTSERMDDSYLEPSSQRTQLEAEDEDSWDNQPWGDSDAEEEQEEDNTEEEPEEENAEDDTEVERHAEAYAKMTEMAAPRPPTRERNSVTPSRKRRRLDEVVNEIADSNTSSRFDSLSPRTSHSNAFRPSARLATPEESRRRSAPSRMDSPFKANTPRKRPRGEEGASPEIACKLEKRNTSSSWIIATAEQLRKKYPQDGISYEKEEFKCLDCDRLFKSGWGKTKRTIYSFTQHLDSKGHKDIRDADRDRQNEKETVFAKEAAFPQCSPPYQYDKVSFLSSFVMPQQPIQCFSLPNIQTGGPSRTEGPLKGIKAAFNQCIDFVENNAASHAENIIALQNQAVASQARTQNQLEEVRESLEAAEKSRKQHNEEMDEKLRTALARTNVQAAQIDQMNDKVESVETKTTAQLENISERLRNAEISTKEHARHINHQFSILRDKTKEDLENLDGKLALSRERNEERFGKMTSEMKSLKESMEKQDDYVHDLESTLQLHSEQLQSQRENDGELRQTISSQIEEHSQITATLLENMDRETTEKMRGLERQSEERINALQIEIQQALHALSSANTQFDELERKHADELDALEKSHEKRIEDFQTETNRRLQALEETSLLKTRALESDNEELRSTIDGFGPVFKMIFDGITAVEERVTSLEEGLESSSHERRRTSTFPRVKGGRLGVRMRSRGGCSASSRSSMRASSASTTGASRFLV